MTLTIFFALLIFAALAIFFLWLYTFFLLADFSPKNANIDKFNKILLIFPHPDDEVLTSGGLIKSLTQANKRVTVHILTKGEKGQEGAIFNPELKEIRTREVNQVAKILGIQKLILDDFGDGELPNKKQLIDKRVREVIKSEKPDLIITYDLSGLYGHPDHIALSEIITSLQNKPKLWYVSFPHKFYALTKLPIHMADNPEFMKRKTSPNLKFFVGFNVLFKIRALYSYKSQLLAFKKSTPKNLPLWFVLSARLFEYYHEVTFTSS